MATIPRWKSRQYEKLTAAIHAAESQGAVVKWNELIKGRQFDVTVRSSTETGDHLTVIECKYSRKPIPVKEIEAFITKSRDAGASRAVVISASNFQSGARRVATEHGIELIELTEVQEIPEQYLEREFISVVNINQISLRCKSDGRVLTLPDSPKLLQSAVRSTVVNAYGRTASLQQVLDKLSERFEESATEEEKVGHLIFSDEAQFRLAGQQTWINLDRITVTFQRVSARCLKFPGVDPITFEQSYKIRNALTGENRLVSGRDIDHGFTTELRAGNFYRDPNLRVNYACLEVGDEDVTLVHLETEQHLESFLATMIGSKECGSQLIPIEDASEIARLETILTSYLQAVEENEK